MIDIDRYQLVVICKWLENPFRIHLFLITGVDFYPIVNYHHQTIRVGFSMKTISSGIVGFSINYHSWRRFVIQLMKPHSRTRFIMNYPLIIMKYTYTLENTLENPLRIADESLNTFVLGSR